MKRQVVVIHGGDAFNSHEAYIKSLRSEKVTADDFKSIPEKRWRHTLADLLGKTYEVFTPDMPSASNAKYAEWKIWFEKLLKFVKKDAVFVGHSLGGIFLAKYFAENGNKISAKAVFLIGAPFNSAKSKDQIADFVLIEDLSLLRKMASIIHVFHSVDDQVVRFTSFKKYRQALPEAHFRPFSDKGHFRMNKFPELAKEIKNL